MAIVLDNKFELEATVYLKTDKEQMPRLVTGIRLTPTGILYHLSQGPQESYHYECEISIEVDLGIKVE